MIDFFTQHYQWIFSGIGVLILGYIINPFPFKGKSIPTNTNNIEIINNVKPSEPENRASRIEQKEESSKALIRLLFIDDNHTDYKMVSILKKSGWINTKSVKDITNLEDSKVLEANLIFVDINGVGTTLFQDQGLGLASALKKKYPNKHIVIYSSETNGDRFHKALREVDDCLYKDAEPIQFINVIESFTNSK